MITRVRSLVPWALAGTVAAAAALLVAPRRASGGNNPTDGAPSGMVAYFMASSCPAGWLPMATAQGRIPVGTADPAASGALVGPGPLADMEDRTHSHLYSGSVTLPPKGIGGSDGSNAQGAATGTVQLMGSADPAPSGLPFVQLLACERP